MSDRDDIIRMAREAGIRIASPTDTIDPRNVYLHELERFFHAAYAAGAKAERKACIRACEEDAFEDQFDGLGEAVQRIQARGET